MSSQIIDERPGTFGAVSTTPRTAATISFRGYSVRQGAVALTGDELDNLRRLYGYTKDVDPLAEAGAQRELLRRAVDDGLRIVAWLSQFAQRGCDPLMEVILLARSSSWDVDAADIEYALSMPETADGTAEEEDEDE